MSTTENEATPKTRIDTLLRRIDLLLEEGKWQEALARCSDVLDIDPECADAYLAQLMAEVHVKNQEGLGTIALDYTGHQSYKNVLRFSDDEHSNELKTLTESAVSLYRAKRKRIRMVIVALVICVIAVVAVIAARTAIANDNPVQKVRNAQIGDIVEYGSYEQDGNESNGAEPLEWIVLDRTDEGTLLVTKDVIDGKPFDEHSFSLWCTSTLRAWLNGVFLEESFTAEERSELLEENLGSGAEDEKFIGSAYDLKDTVSLLTFSDVRTYRPMLYPVELTSYARENGVKDDEKWANIPWWWAIHGDEAGFTLGVVHLYDAYNTDTGDGEWWPDAILGVRPVIWVASAESSDSVK